MKKASKKIVKYLLLMAMIFSEFMTPISALAAETVPTRGDLGVNGVVSDKAIVSTPAYTTAKQDGEVQAIKTVSKVAGQEGKYQVDFTVKGEKVETLKQNDIYVVLAFDTSNSMLCGEHFVRGPGLFGSYDYQIDENDDTTRIRCTDSSGWVHYPGSLTKDKWENAVNAAVQFGTELAKIDNAHISLVNYGGGIITATDFVDNKVLEGTENTSLLSKSDFHYVSDGTNMEAALKEAERKLDEIKDSNVEKYILLIGDGIPTVDDNFQLDSKEAAKKVANDIKLTGIEIFTIGYGLDGIGEAHSILKELSSDCDANGQCSETNYYHNKASISTSNADSIAKIMHSMAIKFGEAKNAGPSATITDNIGDSFKIVNSDGTLSEARTIDLTFGEITPEGETKSFIVQIDENASKGWHDVNKGFILNYKNYLEQDATPIVYKETENQPQVYWEPNNYVVNYYKDSISTDNKLSSYEGYAPSGTEININDINVQIENNQYLTNLPEHYRFDSINPESITVTNDGTVKEINVLYKNEYKYIVNYYYDGQIDSQLTETISVPHGTKINSADYHTKNVKTGYVLDTNNSTIQEYTITDDSVVINVYFERTYDYSVKYYFNSIEGLYTNPAGTATSGSQINASDHFLSFEELNRLGRGDYFVDTTNPNYTPNITIGNTGNNLLEIYYVNPVFSNENVQKTTTTTEITNSTTPVDYKITYSVDITNVKEGSTIITTIVDTLPYEIDENLSQLNNGDYDSATKTITWEISETLSEYTQNKTKTIEYSVVYKNFADISASNNNKLVNSVSAKIVVDQNATRTGDETESTGDADSVEIPVNITGTLKVLYVDENDIPIKEQVGPTTQPVGTRYTTTQEKIDGYTFDRVEGNPSGIYAEGETVVKYIYKKVVVSKNEITKTGPETIKSINDTFTYTITYEGEILNYEGEAKLVLTDTPDFKISELVNTSDRRCSLNNNGEVICNETYNITKNNNKISDTFTIIVKYSNINSAEVGNTVKAVLTYDNIDVPTEDSSTETKVESGDLKVIHNVIDAEGKVIETLKEETTTNLGGVAYETKAEESYGYTLKEVIGKEKGNYIANSTVTVEYRYTKNIGTSEETLEKVGNDEVGTINSKFDYTITYETTITDYKGNATLTIIDTLPYQIDLEKSIFNTNNCTYSYKDGKATITCQYEKAIDKENQILRITENLNLYYIDINENGVTNKVESILVYGETTKENEYEFTTEVTEGKVKVNYVTLENNEYVELTDAVILEGMIDYTYKTEEKEFDNYTLKEVIGEETGVFTLEDTEVTYVYEINELPPKTGVQTPITNGVGYINYLLILLVGLVCRRRYN